MHLLSASRACLTYSSNLVIYTLELIVGGDLVDNSKALQTIGKANGLVADSSAEDYIPLDIA